MLSCDSRFWCIEHTLDVNADLFFISLVLVRRLLILSLATLPYTLPTICPRVCSYSCTDFQAECRRRTYRQIFSKDLRHMGSGQGLKLQHIKACN